MKFTVLQSAAYRVHQPKWGFAPTSGAGAGAHGGRANRPGIDALYLSLQMDAVIGDQALAVGAKGMLFKSAPTGGENPVIYTDALTAADSIGVHDPNNDLPRNQASR